jgi:hypothetical protein
MKLHSVVRIGLVSLMLVGAFIVGQHYPRTVAAQSPPEVGIPDCQLWRRLRRPGRPDQETRERRLGGSHAEREWGIASDNKLVTNDYLAECGRNGFEQLTGTGHLGLKARRRFCNSFHHFSLCSYSFS